MAASARIEWVNLSNIDSNIITNTLTGSQTITANTTVATLSAAAPTVNSSISMAVRISALDNPVYVAVGSDPTANASGGLLLEAGKQVLWKTQSAYFVSVLEAGTIPAAQAVNVTNANTSITLTVDDLNGVAVKGYDGDAYQYVKTDTSGVMLQSPSPSNSTSAGLAYVKSSNNTSSGLVLKNTPANVYGFKCSTTTTAGWLLLLDSATIPINGAVAPEDWWQLGSYSDIDIEYSIPAKMSAGATLVFSTTGPFVLTLSPTAMFSGQVI